MPAVEIKIGADPKQFHSALDGMRSKAHEFGEHLAGIGTKFAAGFAIERILEKALEKGMAMTEEFKKTAEEVENLKAVLGETSEEIQKLRHAANLKMVDPSEMLKGLANVRKIASEAMRGDANANGLFAEMKIDPRTFAEKRPTQQAAVLAAAYESHAAAGKNSAEVLLDLLGSKNRGTLKVFTQGEKGLNADFAATPLVDPHALQQQIEFNERGVQKKAEGAARVGNTGLAIDSQQAARDVGKVSGGLLKGLTEMYGAMKYIFTGGKSKPWYMRPAPGTEEQPAESGEAHGAAGKAAPVKTLTAIERPTFNPTEKAVIAERIHEMDFNSSQLLQDDPKKHAEALQGEQLRIYRASQEEKDPHKAFDLYSKARGMESGILSEMKALDKPDSLHISASKIAEMGGGGPSAVFGGIELKIDTTNGILNQMLAKMGGGDVVYSSGGTAPDGSLNRAGVFPLARMEPSVESFNEKR